MRGIKHIHHISAIVGHPQETIDFYQKVLGMRLVKQTVNFDDKDTYHLYFAGQKSEPEEVMTFFNWTHPDAEGVVGSGQVGRIAFQVPKGSLDWWEKHLDSHDIATDISELFGKKTLEFEDYHHLDLALVEGNREKDNHDIEGFYGTIILSKEARQSAEDLDSFLGLKKIEEDGEYWHFETLGEKKHRVLVKKEALPMRRLGIGTVHHVAWAAADENELKGWQEALQEKGYGYTPIKNRKYFHSIYYREPGKVVFEIATEGPGFNVDEPLDQLGRELQLPEQFEADRAEIEAHLPDIHI